MTVISRAFRSFGLQDELPIEGEEKLTSNMGERVQENIATGADDTPIIFGFDKVNLDALSISSNQDITVKLSGGNPHPLQEVFARGDFTTGQGALVFITGDHTGSLYKGDTVYIQGAFTPANDGRYTIDRVVLTAQNNTTITIFSKFSFGAADRCMDTQEDGIADTLVIKIIADAAAVDILGTDGFTAPSTITVAGDHSWMKADDKILVEDATTQANDFVYTLVSATYDGTDTVIVVEEATIATEVGNTVCTMQHVQTELLIHMDANDPFLWTKNSGVINPALDDVSNMLITNESGSTADVKALVIKSSQ